MSRSRLVVASYTLLILAASSCGKGSPEAGEPARAKAPPAAATAPVAATPPAVADPPAAPTPEASPEPSVAAPTPQLAAPVSIPHGQSLYGRMCAVCHGPIGKGYKADRAPALAHPDFLGSVTDDFLRVAILEGRRATTMSAWGRERGGPLTRQDTDDLIAFMRTWEKDLPKATLNERGLGGDASRGRPIFERECARCHGAGGRGGPHTQLANPQLMATASNGFLRYAIARGRAGTPMEGYGSKLSVQQIDDVIAFVREAADVIAVELAAEAEAETRPPPLPLGPVPLNPKGPQPAGFTPHPGTTKADLVHFELSKGARMALLDARAPSDYAEEHIAGAVSVPFYEPQPYLASLPKNAWLVCYCACPHAESQSLAQKLLAHGFTKVTVLDEGLGFWKMKGYETRTGAKP